MQSNWVDKKLQLPKHSVLAAGPPLLQEQAPSITTTMVAVGGTSSVRPPDYYTEVCRFEMKGKKRTQGENKVSWRGEDKRIKMISVDSS